MNAHVAGTAADGTALPPPTPSEAMATYLMAARLVELELHRAGQGQRDQRDLSITREVLVGTHRMLCAALNQAEERPVDPIESARWRPVGKPALHVVDGGAGVPARSARRPDS